MIIQHRPKLLELEIFRYLHARMDLSENDIFNHRVQVKGYEGELKSDEWLRDITDHSLVLHGLLLKYNGSKFQIDTLVVLYGKIYILDVKYFEGDYHVKGGKWSTDFVQDINNPLHQLERCETLFKKLLSSLGYNYPIESYLVFNHPEFHLYTTEIFPNIIFPSQLNRFLKKLNSRPVKLTQAHHKLAEQLAALHIVESPYERLPAYTYDGVRKAVLCPICFSPYSDISKELFICSKCNNIEEVEDAVLRNVKEFMLLFPDRIITVNTIFDWCGGMKSKKTIWRVLSKHFILVGNARKSHYIPKDNNQ